MTITTVLDRLTFAPDTDDEREFVEFMFQALKCGGCLTVEDSERRMTFYQKPKQQTDEVDQANFPFKVFQP